MRDKGLRIMERYFQAQNKVPTSKMVLADYELLDAKTSKLLMASGAPINIKDAKEWIFTAFNYAMLPIKGSFQSYTTDNGLYLMSAVATYNRIEAVPVKEKTNLVKISANAFLDEKLGEVWEKSLLGNEEYLVRQKTEDLETILRDFGLKANVQLMGSFSFKGIRPKYNIGSTVEFYTMIDGNPMVNTGKVTAIVENTVEVQYGNTKVVVPAGAIINTFKDEGEDDKVIDFLRQSYNPPSSDMDYAGLFKKKA